MKKQNQPTFRFTKKRVDILQSILIYFEAESDGLDDTDYPNIIGHSYKDVKKVVDEFHEFLREKQKE